LPSSNTIKGIYLFYIQATAEGGSSNTLVQYTLEVICGAASTSISEPGGLATGAQQTRDLGGDGGDSTINYFEFDAFTSSTSDCVI
jgi:hypothetical protein